jgi:DNA-binding IclR family transcriptional regulator
VAVPIRAGGQVIAALSVDMPVGRLSLAEMQARYQPRLAEAAAQISAALDGAPAPSA